MNNNETVGLHREINEEVLLAKKYENLGIEYSNQRKWEQAEKYLKKSLELYQRLRKPLGVANQYGNLGNVYLDQGEWEESEECLKNALEIHMKLEDNDGIAQTYLVLGILYKQQEWYKGAFYYLTRVLFYAKSAGGKHIKELSLNHLVDLREKVGDEQYNQWLEKLKNDMKSIQDNQ